MCSSDLGQKNYKDLLSLSQQLIKYGIYLGGLVAIIGAVFYYPIGRLFTKEPEVLKTFYSVFWMVLAMQPLCALAFIFDGMFKGLGKMKDLRDLLLLSTFFVFLPVLFTADYYNLKLHGIFIAFTLWIIARGFPLIIKFRKQFLPLAQNN